MFDDILAHFFGLLNGQTLPPWAPTRRALEEALISRAIGIAGGNQAYAAELLGMQRTTLCERLARRKERRER